MAGSDSMDGGGSSVDFMVSMGSGYDSMVDAGFISGSMLEVFSIIAGHSGL